VELNGSNGAGLGVKFCLIFNSFLGDIREVSGFYEGKFFISFYSSNGGFFGTISEG
jgi:hypothetical protein